MPNVNIKSRTIFHSDNLDILQRINSSSIDLIYLDPPFNKSDTFVGSNKKKTEEIKEWFKKRQKNMKEFLDVDFDELFKDEPAFTDTWQENDLSDYYYTIIDAFNDKLVTYLDSIKGFCTKGGFYYLMYMIPRLIEMKRILKDTGYIYYHCDPTFSHYIKSVLDRIFGEHNFKNEIVWCYTSPSKVTTHFPRKHDIVFFYTKLKPPKLNTDEIRVPYAEESLKRAKRNVRKKGGTIFNEVELHKGGKVPEDWWKDIVPASRRPGEKLGYPTQKPIALLDRIIKASCPQDGIVLDPFCGCATTCIASEKLGREWIGIDISEKAYYMVYYRLKTSDLATQEEDIQIGKHSKSKFNQMILDSADIHLETQKPYRTDETREEQEEKEVAIAGFKHDKKEIKEKNKRMTFDEKELYRELLYEEQKGFCNGCDVYLRKAYLTIDHIKPKANGGEDDYENLQLLCYLCNNWKRTKDMKYLINTLYERSIINKALYNTKIKELGE